MQRCPIVGVPHTCAYDCSATVFKVLFRGEAVAAKASKRPLLRAHCSCRSLGRC